MASLKHISGLKEIIDQYDGYIIDLYGVIHNGKDLYHTTEQALKYLRANNKKVIFLSNAPRPNSFTLDTMNKMGLELQDELIITSGDLVRAQLTNPSDHIFSKMGKKFYQLGYEKNPTLLADVETSFARVDNIEEADFVLITAYIPEAEKKEKGLGIYDHIIEQAVKRGLPGICVNPDKIAPHGDSFNYTAGSFAKRYEEMGGKVDYYGKPYPIAYEKIFEIFSDEGINKDKLLMIGDSLETDILGANNVGIDSMLVMSGTHRALDNEALENLVKECGIIPSYVAPFFGE
jgi:HAD superfamily hydrolase (TIGR01459 family)